MHTVIVHDLHSEAFEWLFVWMRIVGALNGAMWQKLPNWPPMSCYGLLRPSSFVLNQRISVSSLSQSMSRPSPKLPHLTVLVPADIKGRRRSGSIVKVEEVGGRTEELLDRSAYLNINANWVNAKGAWLIHVVLVFMGKIIIDTIPGMTQQISWTLVNLIYLNLSYLMFHWVTGIPFDNELHGGAYDDLTLWEQIDDGAQYTPSKKWLFTAPILLFLASTHYTNYNPWLFAINLTALIVLAIIPKLPQLHRQRVRFLTGDASGFSTPVTPSFPLHAANPADAHFG